MTEPRHGFDEALISGYVDGELTQGEAQRVRVHLEDCEACRATAEGLTRLQEATMSSRFQVPQDLQWDESPRGRTSQLLRSSGLVIGLAWLIGLVGYLIIELVGSDEVLGVLLVGGFVLSAGMILASALLDRRVAQQTDRYGRVKK